MSAIDCEACGNLTEYAPGFVQNGVTKKICNSLKNDTGLNPDLSTLHNNCEDLHDANDCLIGRKDAQLEAYDVCDWKEFMHLLLPNMYELNKAMICSDCGQWKNIHDIWDRTDELCDMIGNLMQPSLKRYGTMPYNDVHPNRVIGHIGQKNGNPLLIPVSRESAGIYYDSVGVGLNYAKKQYTACATGQCTEYEWYTPFFYRVDLSADVSVGDVLWYCTKQELQNASGWSDNLWNAYDESATTWRDVAMNGQHLYAWITLDVNPGGMGDNYIGLIFQGTSWRGDPPVAITRQSLTYGSATNARIVRHTCNN